MAAGDWPRPSDRLTIHVETRADGLVADGDDQRWPSVTPWTLSRWHSPTDVVDMTLSVSILVSVTLITDCWINAARTQTDVAVADPEINK